MDVLTRGVLLVCAASIVFAGCSSEPDDRSIQVTVQLPTESWIIDSVDGSVWQSSSVRAAEFTFEAGWEPWLLGDETEPRRTGAPVSLTITLPGPGTYTFRLGEFGVSVNLCGLCEDFWAGGEVEVTVEDGSVIRLNEGERLASS